MPATEPPQTADVVVVGGGMAGVSVAYELAERCSVVLLEAETDMPVHTTGRSAAFYLPAYGNDVVRGLTAASLETFRTLPERVGAPPLLEPRSVLYVADDDAAPHRAHHLATETVEPISVDGACAEFPLLRREAVTAAAIDVSGSDIDVLGLHQGYVRGGRERGVVVLRGARATGLRRTSTSWEVQTSTVTVSAAHVVNAAGAWCDEVAALAGVPQLGLRPLRRSIFVSPVDAPSGFLRWPLLVDAAERWYAKPEGDALLASPAEEVPHPPGSPQPDMLLIAEAMDRIRAMTTLPLRTVRTQWAGLRTFAPDRTPVVGESEPGSGFWWVAGQGGYGIQLAPALAVELAGQLLDGRPGPFAGALSPARFAGTADFLSRSNIIEAG
ncbi:MAG TPA: FAD-binding oxidoreductase [Mycobacteriales bacterium]|nr:FAD-binding oxidoreductase [Mycobacteriales bacterium]